MTLRLTGALSLVAVLVVSGCAARPRVGVINANGGLDLSRDHYRILEGPGGSLMPAGWMLDNFRLENGVPREAKWTADYQRTVTPDMNDDGRAERPIVIPRYDLAVTHDRTGASAWVQTTPVGTRLGARDLEVIAHDFVDRVGGGSYITIDWGAEAIRERHVGTVIREEGPVEVDGVAAYWVTFEIVSVDQREVNETHQGEWVTVVISRPRARWTPNDRYVLGSEGLSMLVVAGYASRAEHHATLRADFESLLSRIDFHETP